jgi:filamentous hemagglutinin family protein
MSRFPHLTEIWLGLGLAILLTPSTLAQILPDSTLGAENSTVTPNQVINGLPSERIDGGARRGANLFHSFQEFNINEGQTVFFSNPNGVDRIFSRVTGNNLSAIFGKLGVLGNANFFFINPNGIIFGPNAILDVNGSFLATTASSIHLSDGTIFSAKNPQAVPLLAINVPLALGFLESSGKIEVQGRGHNLIAPGDTRLPNVPIGGTSPTGLAVKPAHTLALVGGEVNFQGGVVTAPSGRVEIGSVSSGQVKIAFTNSNNFTLNYEDVSSLQDISLTRRSLVNASGTTNGNISLFGRNINITDASLVLIENQGANPLGTIQVNASDTLTITGTTEFTPVFPGLARSTRGLLSQALREGKGADISIWTNRLIVQDSGRIYLSTFGTGAGGNLTIQAKDSVQILGISQFDPSFPLSSIVSTATAGSGTAGNLNLVTQHLSLKEGGLLSSSVFGSGSGGELTLKAFESINLTEFNPNSLVPSLISSITQGSGPGGNLLINTQRLTLTDGGRVDSSTLASGNAGSLTIDATDFIHVSGTIPGSVNPSLIISSANRVDPKIRQGLGLPEIPTGASGNVNIKTRQLSVTDGASISVRNDGTGDAGNLHIQARSIDLDRSSGITASTFSGNGGNIDLAAERIQLRRNSNITATASGTGNGGNIAIATNPLISLEGSNISANAFTGRGGQVQISAKGAFLSTDSQITASSQFGINGIVAINTPETNIQNSLEPLELRLISPDETIARSCLARRNEQQGSFTYTRTGGVPITPESGINEREALSVPSTTELSPGSSTPSSTPTENEQFISVHPWKSGDPIIRGGAIIRTADGRTLLIAATSQDVNLICQ